MGDSQPVAMTGGPGLDGVARTFWRRDTSWWITAPMTAFLAACAWALLRITDSSGPMNFDLCGLMCGMLIFYLAGVLAIQVAATPMRAWHFGAPGLGLLLPWLVQFYRYPPVNDGAYLQQRYPDWPGEVYWPAGVGQYTFLLFFGGCFLAQALWIRHDGDRRHHWFVGLLFNTLVAAALATQLWLVFEAPHFYEMSERARTIAIWGGWIAPALAVAALQPFNAPMRSVARPFLVAALLIAPAAKWLYSL